MRTRSRASSLLTAAVLVTAVVATTTCKGSPATEGPAPGAAPASEPGPAPATKPEPATEPAVVDDAAAAPDDAATPSEPAAADPGDSAALPKQGQRCDEGRCAGDLSCIEYYGIAGAQGPKFSSCERRCGKGGSCPAGQRCVTIADGPGQVCRPSR